MSQRPHRLETRCTPCRQVARADDRGREQGRSHEGEADVVARCGGEEFALVLPRTELAEAVVLANNIRGAVKERELVKKLRGQSLGPVTLSIGVAAYRPGEPVDDFVHRADAYLYAAKQRGRDRVEADAA